MSDLEELGLIASPHTSAGRVPTPLGYRFFVDSLLVVKQLDSGELHQLEDQLHPDNPQRVDPGRLAAAVAAHQLRRRRDDAAPARAQLPPDRVPAAVGKAHPADRRHARRRRAEPDPVHRARLHALGAGLGGQLHQPELLRPQLRGHPPAPARGTARNPPGPDVAHERRARGERPGGHRGQRAVRHLGRAQPARGAATCRRT